MITFLHTSDTHIATSDALRDRLAPGLAMRHVVREDLLARAIAQGGVSPTEKRGQEKRGHQEKRGQVLT